MSGPALQHRDLLHVPLVDLLARAAPVRDDAHGRRVTFSPKVFIPLTMLCRDRCGYCTFAQPPARLESPYLTPEQVLAIAKAGAAAGCHEALFTLGEGPEDRYPIAREWLTEHGVTPPSAPEPPIATFGAAAESAAVNGRPASSVMPIAWK